MEHHVEYCFQCEEYPCQIYEHADDYDSFITQKNQKADMEKAKQVGIEVYGAEQAQKVLLLNTLLSEYNSGREKTLFCIAVNLLDIEEIKKVLDRADTEVRERPLKEKAAYVSDLLRKLAHEKGLKLKLRKK